MSNTVFPTLPGLGWSFRRTPQFKTQPQENVSGKEVRIAYWSLPRWTWELTYDVLRDNALNELRTLAGFFLQRQGSFDSFLFQDPDDNAVVGQQLGLGNGGTTAFQLVRPFGGFVEPVIPNGPPNVFITDWQGKQLQYTTPRINLALNSEDLTQASWTKSLVNVTANQIASPRGDITADLVTSTNNTSPPNISSSSISIASGMAYTTQVFAKIASGVQWVVVQWNSVSGTVFAYFDLVNVVVGATGVFGSGSPSFISASITPMGNGWFNLQFSGILNSTSSNIQISFVKQSGGDIPPASTPVSAYIWGWDFKLGATPSGYLGPTGSSPLTVTDYTLTPGPTGDNSVVTFAAPPAANVPVTADFSYYFRVRFVDDSADFEKFMSQLWELKKLQFISVK